MGPDESARRPAPAQAGRRGGCLKKLGLALASLCVALAVAELGARALLEPTIAWHEPPTPSITRPSAVRHVAYELEPLASDETHYPEAGGSPARTVAYRVNADGFRDEPFARAKPPGTYRIAVLGDSFTFGMGVRAEDTFAKVLQSELRELVPGRSIEVMNCGVFGYNTHQEIALLKLRVLEYQPDLVIVAFYMNDVVPLDTTRLSSTLPARVSRALGLTFGEPQPPVDAPERVQWWLRSHSRLLDHLGARLEKALRGMAYDRTLRANWGVAGSPGWSEVETYLAMLPDLCREHGAACELVLFPDLTRLGDSYPWHAGHAALRELCARLGIPYFDLLPVVVDRDPRSLQVHYVDHHPNELAHRLVGEALARELAPRLGAGPAPSGDGR